MKHFPCLLILVAIIALSAAAQNPSIGYERDRGITILSAVKNDLKKNYYDPNFHGMDVDVRFKQAEEKIKTATNQNQIFGIIAQALVDLDDSHTYFVPPTRPFKLEYGWKMQMIGQKCYVVAVKPGSDADAKGLKEGDEIYTIDGFGPVRQNLWKIQYLYQALSPRGGMRLEVIKPDRTKQQLDVMAKVTQGKQVMDLLIDSQSGSAAEVFARIVQLEKRGVVIGDVSSGAVMRAKTYDHEHGLDTKIFYGVSITDADIVMTDGRSLERVGVVPDEIWLPTPAALARKQDPVLAYAASLAGVTLTPEKAGGLFPVEWRK